MKQERKTMDTSVFERLDERFSECREEINHDRVMSNGDVPNVMFTAGKALFEAIVSGKIQLGDIPDWFKIEPKGTSPHGGIRHSWDLYWLSAIHWLSKNKLDSGITFPYYIIHPVSLEERLYSGLDIDDVLHRYHGFSDKHLKRAWRQLATASEYACLYLAQISKEPVKAQQDAAPANVINIGIVGDVKAENVVQTGDYASIHKEAKAEKKNESMLIMVLKLLGGLWAKVKWLWTKFSV